jgi:hypothetical protein
VKTQSVEPARDRSGKSNLIRPLPVYQSVEELISPDTQWVVITELTQNRDGGEVDLILNQWRSFFKHQWSVA